MKFLIFAIFSVMIVGFTLNAYSESIDEMHDSALKYMNMQNYVQAIQVYSEILEIDPDDDVALMNRAFAFTMRDDFQSGIQDLTKVLDNNPGNLMALKSKATLLAQFECVSYDNCKPNEALELLDVALDDNPDDEDLKMKRDFLLSKAETFEVSETNGDYMINIQLITRDQNGTLSSVVENAFTDILPSRILDKYLDGKEFAEDTVVFNKEILEIDGQDYMKWHIEKKFETEDDRFWRGAVSLEKRVEAKSDEGYDVIFFKDLLRAIIPAQGFDVGYETLSIMEVFKKI